MSRAKRCIADLLIFIILIAVDRITKVWAVTVLEGEKPIPIIKNVIEFYYLPNGNTGAAFGILTGHRFLFLVIAAFVVLAIAYIVFFMPAGKKYKLIEILLIFIAAGGAGNMIDRFMNGYVVDFIYISCINFPIFNVADMYVSVCTVLLVIIVLTRIKEEDYEMFEKSLAAPFKKIHKKTDEQ